MLHERVNYDMSSQNSLNTTAIAIAVVTLLIGAGAGYFIANNSAQTQISELNNEITDLTSTVSDLETQLTDSQQEITSLEEDIGNLESQITIQENIINQLEDEITSKETTISSLEEQIDSLTAITEVKEGFIQYSLYGFSFEYPNDMITSLSGVLESTATDDSGLFVGEGDNNEVYTITWIYSMMELDVEGAIEGGYANIAEFVSSRSGYQTLEHLGHTVTYEQYSLEDSTGEYTMIIGVFYCPESDKFFNLNYLDQTQQTMENWQELLESFVCHIE